MVRSLGSILNVVENHYCYSIAKLCLTLCDLQHARLPCPTLPPRVCSNSCPWSWWCYPTISSSGAPFLFGSQYFPASGSFPMSQLFASSGQSIGVSASISVLPTKGDPGLISFRMDWLDLLAVQGTLVTPAPQLESINTSVFKLLYGSALTSVHD